MHSAAGIYYRVRESGDALSSPLGLYAAAAAAADKRGLTNYLVLVHVHRPQVGVKQQLVRLDVDGTLPPAFAAQGPLGID